MTVLDLNLFIIVFTFLAFVFNAWFTLLKALLLFVLLGAVAAIPVIIIHALIAVFS